jgi:hypothetical protein
VIKESVEVMSDTDLAADRMAQADRMKRQAAELIAEAERLSKEATELNPGLKTNGKKTKVKAN